MIIKNFFNEILKIRCYNMLTNQKGRVKMSKSAKIIAFILSILVIIGAGISIDNILGKNLKPTSKISAKAENEEINISWKKVKHADGYILYSKPNTSEEFSQLAKLEGNKTTSYKTQQGEKGSVTEYAVEAYKNSSGKTYKSKLSKTVQIAIAPETVGKPNAISIKKGEATLNWNAVNGLGYDIEYVKGNFENPQSDATQVFVENPKQTKQDFTSLEEESIYSFKIRAFVLNSEEKIYSEWSEPAEVKIKSSLNTVDPSKPMIALTFDDGPNYKTTKRLLDILEQYNAKATFFMVGNRTQGKNAELLKRELEMGCELGNHTYDHSHYGKNVTKDDITRSAEAIKKASGQYPTAFRCTGGIISDTIRKNSGAPIYYWSVDTEDWKSRNADAVARKLLSEVSNGDIILMHDIYETTIDAVEKVMPELVKRGYQFVTVSELMQANNIATENGKQYFSATSKHNEK